MTPEVLDTEQAAHLGEAAGRTKRSSALVVKENRWVELSVRDAGIRLSLRRR